MVASDGHSEMATFQIDHFVPFFSATLAKKIVTAEKLMGASTLFNNGISFVIICHMSETMALTNQIDG